MNVRRAAATMAFASLCIAGPGCGHLGHRVGPLPGGQSRLLAHLDGQGWSVDVEDVMRGEHSERIAYFTTVKRDMWTVSFPLLITPAAGRPTDTGPIWDTRLNTVYHTQYDRPEAMDVFAHTTVQSCVSTDRRRALLRLRWASAERTLMTRPPGDWLAVYFFDHSLAVTTFGHAPETCEFALRSVPIGEAFIRSLLVLRGFEPSRSSFVRVIRGNEPAADMAALPVWAGVPGFVLAAREHTALDDAIVFAIAMTDVRRAQPLLTEEFATLTSALADSHDTSAADALERALTPGHDLPVDPSTPIGTERDPASVMQAGTWIAALPSARRAQLFDGLTRKWTEASTRPTYRETWRFRALAAAVGTHGDAASCDALLDALPSIVDRAGDAASTSAPPDCAGCRAARPSRSHCVSRAFFSRRRRHPLSIQRIRTMHPIRRVAARPIPANYGRSVRRCHCARRRSSSAIAAPTPLLPRGGHWLARTARRTWPDSKCSRSAVFAMRDDTAV